MKHLFSLLFIVLGAVFIAPCCYAYTPDEVVANICNEYDLDRSTCNYLYTYTYRQGDNRIICAVYPSDTMPSLRYGSGIYGNSPGMNFQFVNGYTWTDNNTSSGVYTNNGTAQIAGNIDDYNTFDLPHSFYGSFDSVSFTPYQNGQNLTESQAVLYNQIANPVTNKATFPVYKTLYSQYMLDKGLSIDSAFLADNNFNVVLEMPIVTSYNELDSDYSGFYCLSTVNTYTFKFELARTPGYVPSTEWFDTYLIIGYTLPTNTECTIYFGTVSDFFHPFCYKRDDASQYLTLDNFQNEKKFAVSDTVIYGFSVSASPPGDPANGAYTGIKWRVQSPAVEISPLYLSFTYAYEENGTVTEGEGSDDYDGFINTFINNVTFSTYQSVSVSVPNYDGSYDITYDSNFLYLMDKIFNVNFISQMVVGVLAVSMACYIIFGKML